MSDVPIRLTGKDKRALIEAGFTHIVVQVMDLVTVPGAVPAAFTGSYDAGRFANLLNSIYDNDNGFKVVDLKEVMNVENIDSKRRRA